MRKITSIGLGIFKHPLFSGSFVMVVGSISTSAINYFYHLIMGRMLGPAGYGVLASVFSILYIISILPTSASFSIVKFISSAKDKREVAGIYSRLYKLVLKISLIFALLMFVLSFPLTKFLKIDSVITVVGVAPILFLSLMTLMIQSVFQGLLQFWKVVLPNVISSMVKLFLGVLLVYFGFSVNGAMLGVVIGGTIAFLYGLYIAKSISRSKKEIEFDIKPFYKYALPVFMQSLAFTSFITVDVLLAKHFLDPYSAGLYAALSTLGKIIFFASQPITQVMFPIVSKRSSRGEGYKNIFLISLVLTLSMSFVIVGLYYLFPDLAIGILYGEDYLAAKQGLTWIGITAALYTASNLLANFFLSIGKTRIVIFPIVLSVMQIIGISIWHENYLQVIYVTLVLMALLFVGLVGFLGYNYSRKYAFRYSSYIQTGKNHKK